MTSSGFPQQLMWVDMEALGARSPFEDVDRMTDTVDGDDVDTLNEGGLGAVCGGHQKSRPTIACGVLGHGQRPLQRAEGAIERQLSHGAQPTECRGPHLSRRRQDRKCDGQVVLRPDFAQVGGREIDDDPLCGDPESLVDESRAHTLARLLHCGVGKTDHRERRHARSKVGLDVDRRGVETKECGTDDVSDHAMKSATDRCVAAHTHLQIL